MSSKRKRAYEKEKASILSQIKTRRKSHVWNRAIERPKHFQLLRKCDFNITKDAFTVLETQLFFTKCISQKENATYIPHIGLVDHSYFQSKVVYWKLFRFLPLLKVLHLCIWIFANQYVEQPTVQLQRLFEVSASDFFFLEDIIEETETKERVVKRTITKFRINDNYELRNVVWTVRQRAAAKHTRNYYLRHFARKTPMLEDLELNEDNEKMLKEFFFALMKADVDYLILCSISCDQLHVQLADLVELPQIVPKKIKQEAAIQRTSITNFEPLQDEIRAAHILQRWYQKRYVAMKEAVRTIEAWWEPYRLETEELRIEVAEEHAATVEAMIQAEEQLDLLKWDELVEETKADYKSARSPVVRTKTFWARVALVLTGPVVAGVVGGHYMQQSFLVLLALAYGAGQLLTMYRLDPKYMWGQTLLLAALTGLGIEFVVAPFSSLRLVGFVVVVAAGRKKWWVLLLAWWAFRGVLVAMGADSFLPSVHFGMIPFDVYACTTMASGARQGTAVQVVHKVMVNWVVLLVLTAVSTVAGAIGCMYLGHME